MISPPSRRDQHRPPAQVVVRRDAVDASERLPVIKQVREQVDQSEEHQRGDRTEHADHDRDPRDPHQADLRREIPCSFMMGGPRALFGMHDALS